MDSLRLSSVASIHQPPFFDGLAHPLLCAFLRAIHKLLRENSVLICTAILTEPSRVLVQAESSITKEQHAEFLKALRAHLKHPLLIIWAG